MRAVWIALGLLALAPAAQAQSLEGAKQVFIDVGRCEKLVMAGDDYSAGCQGKMANIIYEDQRAAFIFFINDLARVSFVGDTRKQPRVDDDGGEQPLSDVSFKLMGAPMDNIMPAEGKCTYGNPTKGPAMVRCEAESSMGKFVAWFRSTGEPMAILD